MTNEETKTVNIEVSHLRFSDRGIIIVGTTTYNCHYHHCNKHHHYHCRLEWC